MEQEVCQYQHWNVYDKAWGAVEVGWIQIVTSFGVSLKEYNLAIQLTSLGLRSTLRTQKYFLFPLDSRFCLIINTVFIYISTCHVFINQYVVVGVAHNHLPPPSNTNWLGIPGYRRHAGQKLRFIYCLVGVLTWISE